MIKVANFLLSLIILFSFQVNGQELDSAKLKQLDFFKKITYHSNSSMFKNEKLYSKLDKDFTKPWEKENYSKDQINEALDSLIKNATVSFDENDFLGNGLEFESYFPKFITGGIMNLVEVDIVDFELYNKNSDPIKIRNSNGVNIGSKSLSGFKDGKSYAYNWKTLNTSFSFEEKSIDSVSGKIKFKASFISDYHYQKITKNDKGETFTIGELTFDVVDVIDNKVVLNFHHDSGKDLYKKVEQFNLDNENNRIKQIPFFEFAKMKREDDSLKDEKATGELRSSIYAFHYNLFKENPKITYEEFDELVDSKMRNILTSEDDGKKSDEEFGDRYIVYSTVAEIQNFYLYLPKTISKDIELKL